MNVDEAWETFIKSHQIKKASIDEKLDVIASQMNELQTDVSRLAENIPEMQGDAAAMETANAMAGPEMGAEPGLDELGAAVGGEEMPMEEAPMEGAPGAEEGAPMEAPMDAPMGAPGPMEAPMEAPMGEDEITDEELDALLGGPDLGAPEMGGTGNDMIGKIKELIMNEDDPGKLAALSELLAMAANSDGVGSMEGMGDAGMAMGAEPGLEEAPGPVEEEPVEEETEAVGKSETFEKTGAIGVGTEPNNAAENATDKPLTESPEPLTSDTVSTTDTVTKACDSSDLMSRIMEAITPIIREYVDGPTASPIEEIMSGAIEPEVVVDVETDAMPIDEEPAKAPVAEEPAVAEDESEEEDSEEKEDSDEESGEDKEGEEGEDDEEKDPEDDISEDTDHFEESDCKQDSEPVMKSFHELFSQKMESRVGIDGNFSKVPAYLRESQMKDGFQEKARYEPIVKSSDEETNGKHIATYSEMESFLKSDRPGSEVSVNGDIDRPDPLTFKKSNGAGGTQVSFEELMKSSNPHELMKKEWDEYNLFKSRY